MSLLRYSRVAGNMEKEAILGALKAIGGKAMTGLAVAMPGMQAAGDIGRAQKGMSAASHMKRMAGPGNFGVPKL